ncbi:hypothetical protein PRVXH_002674 [Proteinivorax hydrogeniformans]|uniref:Regulatory protein YycH domain-containing protein n=1 Tax=Proteinivorax hydrogeniformans TaxID=1826727 RepID=A0AAU8HT04_9FIRM
MSREALKSYLLIAMVGLSVVLTTYLVVGTANEHPPIDQGFESVYVGRVPDYNDLVVPWQTVITSGKEEGRLLNPNVDSYYFLVENIIDSLSFDGLRVNWVMSGIDLNELKSEGVFLNYGHWDSSVGFDLTSTPLGEEYLPYPEIHAVYFNADSQRIAVFNYELGAMWTQQAHFNTDYVTELIEEVERQDRTLVYPLDLNKSDGIVFAPHGRQEMLRLIISPRETDLSALKQSFFPALTAREIQEKDGSTIVTDGVSGLRIYPDDVFEYTSTKESSGPVYLPVRENLEIAIDFIGKHGGWPARSSYLRRVNKVDAFHSEVQLDFGYYAYGYPLVADDSSIEVTLQGGKVTRYYRNTVSPVNLEVESVNRNVINYLFALNIAEREEVGRVRKMYLAYHLGTKKDGVLDPVWVIKGEHKNIYIQGYTGDIVEISAVQGGA